MAAGPPGKHMRFLICGIGSIGQRHYKNLLALGHECAIFRSGQNTGYNRPFMDAFFAEQAQEGKDVQVFWDLDEALSQFESDAVFVTNPTSQHLDTALWAAKAGKHVFIEKPVTATFEGLAELEELVEKKSLTVMVGYNFRFHPLLQKMKELFEGGAIGRTLSAHVEMGENIEDWHPWENYTSSYGPWQEKGGGTVLCFSHDIDYLYWFLGSPQKILAVGGKMTPLEGDAEDMTKSLWEFPNGAIASVHLDYWQRPHRRQFQLIGTEGTLIWNYYAESLALFPHDKQKKPEVWNLPKNFDRNDMFIEEAKNFIDAVKNHSTPAITLEQGIDVLKICLEIKEQLQR
ncbi:Gfo/Idh/MocA family oxidoreductase [Patescibacteria group bacterium]|nr:Gfo/Idh/MocA family oxidoreductase [Patescibacteria group bacterium]